jgi:hypothetical protein
MNQAIKQIQNLPTITGDIMRIRMEQLSAS